MTEVSIYDFVEARLDETESYIAQQLRGYMIPIGAEIQAMFHIARIVLAYHKKWPVLIEGPTEIEPPNLFDDFEGNLNSYRMSMTKKIDFLIHEEYVKRFGEDPPTTKMLRQYASIWSNHPDFNASWWDSSNLVSLVDKLTKSRVVSPDDFRKQFGMPPRE